jgi:hypothetical protein
MPRIQSTQILVTLDASRLVVATGIVLLCSFLSDCAGASTNPMRTREGPHLHQWRTPEPGRLTSPFASIRLKIKTYNGYAVQYLLTCSHLIKPSRYEKERAFMMTMEYENGRYAALTKEMLPPL